MNVYGAASFTRSLASLLGAPIIAFAAFMAGLAATTILMPALHTDAVFVLCFGLAFLGGLLVTSRVSRSLAGGDDHATVVRAQLVYSVSVAILSFVLIGIINDLRSQ